MPQRLKKVDEDIQKLRKDIYEASKEYQEFSEPELVRISQKLDNEILKYQTLLKNMK